jgi:hypothetical protein
MRSPHVPLTILSMILPFAAAPQDRKENQSTSPCQGLQHQLLVARNVCVGPAEYSSARNSTRLDKMEPEISQTRRDVDKIFLNVTYIMLRLVSTSRRCRISCSLVRALNSKAFLYHSWLLALSCNSSQSKPSFAYAIAKLGSRSTVCL